MKNIPTAEEFILKYSTTLTDGTILCSHDSRVKAMTEFTKLHCQAQLEEILKKVKVVDSENFDWKKIDNDSILNAYPMTNIK